MFHCNETYYINNHLNLMQPFSNAPARCPIATRSHVTEWVTHPFKFILFIVGRRLSPSLTFSFIGTRYINLMCVIDTVTLYQSLLQHRDAGATVFITHYNKFVQ